MTHFNRAVAEQALILLLAAAFIAQQLTGREELTPAIGLLAFAAIAVLLPRLKGATFVMTAAFAAGGIALLLAHGADARAWFEAAGMNATIVTLFCFAPLFGIPVRLPHYAEALRRFYDTKVKSGAALFAGTQLLTLAMGAFLNVGSISVVYHLAFAKPRGPKLSAALAGALNRGFAGAIMWSPYFAAMTLVTSALSVRWTELLPYLLGLSALSFAVGFLAELRNLRDPDGDDAEREAAGKPPSSAEDGRKGGFPVGLAVYLVAAIGAILLLERVMNAPMVLITCMAALFYPLVWCALQGFSSVWRQGIANHLTVTLPALKKEIALFLAAGFFSGSIGTTGIGESLPSLLGRIPLPVAVSFSVLAVALIVATSLAGLHPIVLVSIAATGIEPSAVHLSADLMALLLLGSWGISNTISPASAVNNLLAGLYGKPVFRLASLNYKYAACMAVALLLLLAAVGAG